MSSVRFYQHDPRLVIEKVGHEGLLEALKWMVLIRQFETRAEGAYLQGKIGGFFHSYIGQEAVQVAALSALGAKNWWITTYRCHALALLLGASPEEVMSELFGRANGNAKGRGGSMHLYAERLLGGFGIVGGQLPIATGAGFTIQYLGIDDEIAVCFLGDGAVAQGAFHEALNLAALWRLPCLFVIENNLWGMGTHVTRAVSVSRLAEDKASGYGIQGYTFDGMDFLNCFAGFEMAREQILRDKKPVLIEVLTERFKGHSISDPGLYRSRECVEKLKQREPIHLFKEVLRKEGILDDEMFKSLEREMKEVVVDAISHAENSPWPSLESLEKDVFAP